MKFLYSLAVRALGPVLLALPAIAATAPQYSYATAIGLFSGLIGLILVSSSNLLSRKLTGESIY